MNASILPASQVSRTLIAREKLRWGVASDEAFQFIEISKWPIATLFPRSQWGEGDDSLRDGEGPLSETNNLFLTSFTTLGGYRGTWSVELLDHIDGGLLLLSPAHHECLSTLVD
jgi:hypothetical protein